MTKIICDNHMWTEIDLDWYVRNYYVNRQVIVTRINPNHIWNFQIFS